MRSVATRKKHKAIRAGGLKMIHHNRHQAHNLKKAHKRSGRA
jgi:hypothetical protein